MREVAGSDADVEAVHGLTRPEFAHAVDRGEAREALGLPADGRIVIVSGGGWGVGDLDGAIGTALAQEEVDLVACLCGRNDDLRARLAQRYAGESRVRLVGFTDQMSEWLGAADALIHSTGGLTVLEAYVRGCPTISYGWGRGHLRANNAAFERHGIADVVGSERELGTALRGVLGSRRAPGLALAALPSAASLVLSLTT